MNYPRPLKALGIYPLNVILYQQLQACESYIFFFSISNDTIYLLHIFEINNVGIYLIK